MQLRGRLFDSILEGMVQSMAKFEKCRAHVGMLPGQRHLSKFRAGAHSNSIPQALSREEAGPDSGEKIAKVTTPTSL